MTNYEKEVLKNIERQARHGRKTAETDWDGMYVELFQAILDEVGRINEESPNFKYSTTSE